MTVAERKRKVAADVRGAKSLKKRAVASAESSGAEMPLSSGSDASCASDDAQMDFLGSDSDGAMPDDFGGASSDADSADSALSGSDLESIDDDASAAGDAEAPAHSSNLITNADEEVKDAVAAKARIDQIVPILQDYRAYVERTRAGAGADNVATRADLLRQLARDVGAYYGYNDYLASAVLRLFPVAEAIDFLEANETPRPVTIRTNTLKTRRRDLAQALTARGVTLQPLDLALDAAAPKGAPGKAAAAEPAVVPIALQIVDSKVPVGATPEYLAGHYMLQTAASLLPVLALGAAPGERVLDMSAAPGGKATHLAAMMGNTGALFANDRSEDRAKALAANIHRMGVANAVVTCMDGRDLPTMMGGFDRVLLDAPCSGTGVVSKDPSVKTSRSEPDVARLTHTQKELVLAAIDAAKVGGTIVYSTCSVLVDENEAVVDYALRKRPNVRLVPTGLCCDGRQGLPNYCGLVMHPSLRLAQRFYPHVHNMDGFFVAKLVKTAPTPKPPAPDAAASEEAAAHAKAAAKKFRKGTRPLNANN